MVIKRIVMIWNNNGNKSQSTNEVFLSGLCNDDNHSRWIKTNAFNMKLRREMNHSIIVWTGSMNKRATFGQGLQAQANIIIAVFAHLDMGSIGHKIRIRTSQVRLYRHPCSPRPPQHHSW